MPKFWRYRPEPMNRYEKVSQIILGAIVDLFPFLASIYGIIFLLAYNFEVLSFSIMIVITAIVLLFAIRFDRILRGNYCLKCPNFSCPMNKVPKYIKDEFLMKNPVMREAWENKGHEIGESQK